MAADIGSFYESEPEPEKGARESRRISGVSGIPECAANYFPIWIVKTVKVSGLVLEALRSHRNEIDPTRYSASS